MSPVQQLTDMGGAVIPPVADRPVQRTVNGSVDRDARMEKVGCSVGQSCFRMDSEDTFPALQDAYDDCGDDRFSPGISDRMSLNCHVDLDSLWMVHVHWEDSRTVETGSRAGVSAWRSVLCGIARMSCLPECPVNDGLIWLKDLGRNCIMDLSACGTLSPADSVAGGTDGPLSSSDWAGVLIPAVPAGPVGLDGTLSPTDCVSGILVDPGGMFPSSDLARMRGPSSPAGLTVLMGPVGRPCDVVGGVSPVGL